MKRALKAIAFNAIIVALLVAGLFYNKEGAMNVFAGIATVAFVLSFAMVSESNMACLKAKGKPSLPIWMNVWIDSWWPVRCSGTAISSWAACGFSPAS